MNVVSFVNMKGGVAKTTLAINVADCLARRYRAKVLVIDIDPQFNATQCLLSGTDYIEGLKAGKHTIIDVFDDSIRPLVSTVGASKLKKPTKIKDVIPWKIDDNLHLLPGNLELYRLEMGAGQGRENRLKRYIDYLDENYDYDYVIIDTPPTPSAWMASALIASKYYIVPVKPEPLSATGIELLRGVVSKIEENHDLNLECAGVVLTMVESHTKVFREATEIIDKSEFWRGKRYRRFLPKRTEIARMQGKQGKILDASDVALRGAINTITREFIARVNSDGK